MWYCLCDEGSLIIPRIHTFISEKKKKKKKKKEKKKKKKKKKKERK